MVPCDLFRVLLEQVTYLDWITSQRIHYMSCTVTMSPRVFNSMYRMSQPRTDRRIGFQEAIHDTRISRLTWIWVRWSFHFLRLWSQSSAVCWQKIIWNSIQHTNNVCMYHFLWLWKIHITHDNICPWYNTEACYFLGEMSNLEAANTYNSLAMTVYT